MISFEIKAAKHSEKHTAITDGSITLNALMQLRYAKANNRYNPKATGKISFIQFILWFAILSEIILGKSIISELPAFISP